MGILNKSHTYIAQITYASEYVPELIGTGSLFSTGNHTAGHKDPIQTPTLLCVDQWKLSAQIQTNLDKCGLKFICG